MTPTASTPLYDVFISYARKDGEPHAAKLETTLAAAGYSTWRDKRGIDPALDFTTEIENAIAASRFVTVCITTDVTRENSFVRREVSRALRKDKPVIVTRFEDADPPISLENHTWLDFFRTGWDAGVSQLLDWLRRYTSGSYVIPPPSATLTADPYRDYVTNLYDGIVSYLDQTVIRLIEVGVNTSPEAVGQVRVSRPHLLASFMARAGKDAPETPVHSVSEGMAKYANRLLLLGEPGAGKTTALMSYARDAVVARLNDPAAPLPVLLRCAQWVSSPPLPLDAWIAESTDIPADAAQAMQTDGKLLLLLDGLDELGSSRTEEAKEGNEKVKVSYDPRKRFLDHTLPAAGPVMLSCRVQDYADIHQQAKLNGAVTLQPLTDEQIQDYLRDLPDLWAALQADAGLLEVARTPLLLSFFAYGFKDAPEEAKALRDLSKAQLGDKIFERYVNERYAHEERRLQDMGQTPPFTLDEIYDVLGHVAMINASGGYRRGDYYSQIEDNILLERDFAEKLDVERVPSLIAFGIELNLLTQVEGTLRFIHLRLRDHLVRGYCLPRLRDATLYTVSYEPGPAQALGSLPDGEALDDLLAALAGDGNADVRLSAASALGRIGGNRVVDGLLAALAGDADADVRRFAAYTLGEIRERWSVDGLLAALAGDADEYVRRSAAYAVGRIGGNRAVDVLLAMLAGDADADVRRVAVNILGTIGDTQAVNGLLAALAGDADADVRRVAVNILGTIGGERAVDGLLAALAGDAQWNVRESAANALGTIGGERAVDGLLAALAGDAQWNVRESAANALGRIGDARAVEGLLAARAGDADVNVRLSAASALGKIGGDRAVDSMLILLVGNTDAVMRRDAANILGRIGGERAVDGLLTLLAGDADKGARRVAASALGRIGDARAADGLLAALAGDADADVRRDAADALGWIGGERVVPALIAALADTAKTFWGEVCDTAAEALEHIGTPEALEAVRQWREREAQRGDQG